MTVPDFQGESIGYNMHFGRSGSLMVSVRALQVLAGGHGAVVFLGKALNSDSHSVSLHPGV